MRIKFSAFSFLKKKFTDKGIECSSSIIDVPDNMSVDTLIEHFGFDSSEIEAAFVNHKIMPKSTILQENDKVALVPPGGIPIHVAAYIGKGSS